MQSPTAFPLRWLLWVGAHGYALRLRFLADP